MTENGGPWHENRAPFTIRDEPPRRRFFDFLSPQVAD